MGSEWHSNPGQNLMCSIIYKTNAIAAKNVFIISQIAALAVKDTVDNFINEQSMIKWPNDIYVGFKKISGMLIENQWQGHQLTAIIGIGINVNQTDFDGFPTATSISLINGKSNDVKLVLKKLVENLEKYFFKIRANAFNDLRNAYHENMMFLAKSQVFKSKLETFRGVIQGVNESGLLCIKKVDGSLNYFELKEVEFVF
jgi:BirA family biotin operon repressor/biotin-[acetyl-CoA-carboxylase] ligase